MSSINKIKNLRNRIENRTSEITKGQIIAHNKERFAAHFDDGAGEVFVYPQECVKSAQDGKKHGFVYQGIYQGADLLGVRVYESDKVELNKFENLKVLKSQSGKDLFSLDELVEFDYNNTQKVWKRDMFNASPRKNKMQAVKEVVTEIVQAHLGNIKKNQM